MKTQGGGKRKKVRSTNENEKKVKSTNENPGGQTPPPQAFFRGTWVYKETTFSIEWSELQTKR